MPGKLWLRKIYDYLWEKFNKEKSVELLEDDVDEKKDETCVMRNERDSILKWKADDHDLLSVESWIRKSIFAIKKENRKIASLTKQIQAKKKTK